MITCLLRFASAFHSFLVYTSGMTKDHSLAITLRPYIAGGSGAIFSSMCIHPIDLVKVRLQVANSTVEGKVSAISIAKNVVKNEGV